jgi:putative ABC transport system permease protein
MIQNYFKTAFRNLQRNSRHALLNMLGLGVALAACIIVFLVIQYETSYDKHLQRYTDIYQVVTKDVDADGEHFTNGVPFPTIKYLRQDYPDYKFAQLMQEYGVQVTVRDNSPVGKKFREETGIFYGEPELAEIFELKFLSGNAKVLSDVNSAVISKSLAEKYYGNWKEAVGQRLNIDNAEFDWQVAAVFDDVPENSDFPFTFIASYAGFESHNGNGWPLHDWGSNTSNHQVYVLFPKGAGTVTMSKDLLQFEKKYNNKETKRTHFLQPLKNIHFDERFANNGDHITSKTTLYTLALTGLLVILMACINFINLSSALAVTRSKEVGVRKVLGGSRAQLRLQVFAETTLVVVLALGLAIILAALALPYVKNVMVVQGQLQLFNSGSMIFFITTAFITILLSGFYPALILSRFKPVEAIKNKISTSRVGSVPLRRLLVIMQFAFSQIFVIATVVVISQMNFIRRADLGFTKNALLVININSDSISRSRHEALSNALAARSDVQTVSFAFDTPSSDNIWGSNFAYDEMKDRDFGVQLKMADHNYAATYGLQLIAGSFYEKSDTCRGYVVNETLLKKCNVQRPQDAIGKMFRLGGRRPMPVVGVVKDFKQASLREAVQPIAIFPNNQRYQCVGIKLASNNLLKSNDEIKKIWDRIFPEYIYTASFLDERINRFYEQEQRLSNMYKIYALLALFISCLGLYGLVSFMVVQKSKEVGIRKVLGASVQGIMYLFSKEFTILIFIAFALAAPAAWYLMHEWLGNFVYKITVGPLVFILAILISVLIAWVTVGYKAFRASTVNPVKSLRAE